MKREHHDQPDLKEFEERLRLLAPRLPIATVPLLEEASEPNQVAGGRRWWSVDIEVQRAFYRTVGLSASVGALFGAACTLLILRWSEVPDPNASAPVVASSENVLSDNTPIFIDNNQNSLAATDDGPSLAHAELQPQDYTHVRVSSRADFPYDWLEGLGSLKPGTLEVGTRLVSRHSARQSDTRNKSTFESTRISSDEPFGMIEERSVDSSRSELGSAPLPQRQWMRQMLNSPNEFF